MSVKNVVGGKRLIGSKFYTFEDGSDEATIYRLIKYKESKEYFTLINESTDEIIQVSEEDMCKTDSKYTLLNPDGLMTFTIAKMPDGLKDVIIAVHDIGSGNMAIPSCICRQCVEDIFINKTTLYNGQNFHVGISVSQLSCPANVDFKVFLTVSSVEFMVSTAVYIDDTLEDFKKYIFPGINIKKFNTILTSTKNHLVKNNVQGLVGSVEELMTLNNFMFDFHTSFNIVEMDVYIDDEVETLNEEDSATFIKYIAEEVSAIYVTKYSKTFSLDSIKRKFVLVNPKRGDSDSIYIVGYDEIDSRKFVAENYQE